MTRARGFTLLEVLVALTLTSLLVVALFGGFRAGIRSWQTVERHTAQVEEPRQLSSLLYRHLGQMVPAAFGDREDGGHEAAFFGEAQRVRYVAPLAMSANGLPYVFELTSNQQGRPGVWVRFGPYQEGKSAEAVLADAEYQQVSKTLGVTFAYYGAGDDFSQIEHWTDTYKSDQLPRLVSLRIAGSDRAWPAMTFAVTQVGKPRD